MARSKKKSPGRGFKHGGYSLMVKAGDLPKKMTRIREYLGKVRAGLVLDIAGQEEDLSTAQLILIDRTISLLSVLRTIESSLSERGILQGKGQDLQLQPILANNYLAYSNSLRLILRELGIDRRAGERILTPLEIAAEIDREKTAQEARTAVERPVAASADAPECPGKGIEEDESGVSRGEGEKQPHHLTQDERSPEGEAQGQGPEAGEGGKP